MDCETLTAKYRAYVPDGDVSMLEKAYLYSEEAHSEQKRASGEKYFIHCYAVADTLILANGW